MSIGHSFHSKVEIETSYFYLTMINNRMQQQQYYKQYQYHNQYRRCSLNLIAHRNCVRSLQPLPSHLFFFYQKKKKNSISSQLGMSQGQTQSKS